MLNEACGPLDVGGSIEVNGQDRRPGLGNRFSMAFEAFVIFGPRAPVFFPIRHSIFFFLFLPLAPSVLDLSAQR